MGQGGLMSAVNSNSGDRDLEAIERAQRAHEPSMEEILASIRNIIADERNAAKGAAPKPPHPAPAPMPQIVYSKDAAAPQGDAPELAQRPDAGGPTVVWRRPQVEAERAAEAPQRNEEPLLSPEANEAAALSFGALSANLAVRSAELADEHGARDVAADAQAVARREPPGHCRASGAGGNPASRARRK